MLKSNKRYKDIMTSENLIKLEKANIDNRGFIQSIINEPHTNVSIIESKKLTLRSNHYHLTDYHYMYVLNGEIDYFYKNIENHEIRYLKVKEKQNRRAEVYLK